MEKKEIQGYPHILYRASNLSDGQILENSDTFLQNMLQRRSIREFDRQAIPHEVLRNIIQTAASAPSGANKQPWTFCIVSDPTIKRQIRIAAEEEEKLSYESRMSETWIQDLKPLGTDWKKPFLEKAPHLIVVFKQSYGLDKNQKVQHYYVNESVGIACGFMIAAIHQAGLVTLTHTPSPMNFLSKILNRPSHEKPFLLLPVGRPLSKTYVPDITKKSLNEVLIEY